MSSRSDPVLFSGAILSFPASACLPLAALAWLHPLVSHLAAGGVSPGGGKGTVSRSASNGWRCSYNVEPFLEALTPRPWDDRSHVLVWCVSPFISSVVDHFSSFPTQRCLSFHLRPLLISKRVRVFPPPSIVFLPANVALCLSANPVLVYSSCPLERLHRHPVGSDRHPPLKRYGMPSARQQVSLFQ